ncbi:MAG: hypothetical protein KBT36_16810 [Kurthia sp.]|nr:hypothetical protein [Candidatus Kurthia equi]
MSRKWIVTLFVLIGFILTGSFSFTEANATSSIHVKVTTGIVGIQKEGKAMPVEVELKNSGDDFSGDVVVNEVFTLNGGAGIAQPVSLKTGEKKTLHFLLDRYSMGDGKSRVQIFEGNYKKGKKISYTGDGEIASPSLTTDERAIVSLNLPAKQADLFKVALANSNDFMYKNSMHFIAPTDYRDLDAISMLFIQENTVKNWSDAQKHALALWVQKGGTLYVQGNAVLPEELEVFQPLIFSQNESTLSNEQLNDYFKTEKQTYDIQVKQASLNREAQLLTGDERTPLIAQKQAGDGWIIQSSFNEFASNQPAFTKMTAVILAQAYSQPKEYMEDFYNRLATSTEIFPAFHFSAQLIVAILFLYVLLIAPILYIILKRRDTREYAWWIIPLGAVIMSVCIFVVNANGRLFHAKVQQASVTTIGEQQASTYFSQSVLTNKSGDLQIEAPANTYLMRHFQVTKMNTIMNEAVFKQTTEKSTLDLRDLRYWGVATTIGKVDSEELGNFTVNLTAADAYLQGEVTNNLAYDIREATVWSGKQTYQLGDIKKGQTIQVKEKLKENYLVRPISLNNSSPLENPTDKSQLATYQHQSIEEAALVNLELKQQPIISGWVADEMLATDYKNLLTKQVNKNLIMQSFQPVINLKDEFTLKNEQFSVDLEDVGADSYYETDTAQDNWIVTQGNYRLTYQLPTNFPLDKIHWKELKFVYNLTPQTQFSIYNVSHQQYETLKTDKNIFKKNVEDYISATGTVQFKLDKGVSDEEDIIEKPLLQLKGVKKND